MLTLQEAIKHTKEVANKLSCSECGKEHEQLANWLEELKEFKDKEIKTVASKFKNKKYTFNFHWTLDKYSKKLVDGMSFCKHSGNDEYITTAKTDIDAWNQFNHKCSYNYDNWIVDYLSVEEI